MISPELLEISGKRQAKRDKVKCESHVMQRSGFALQNHADGHICVCQQSTALQGDSSAWCVLWFSVNAVWLWGFIVLRVTCTLKFSSFSPTGLLMNLKYYVSPYDLFEDGSGAPVILHENNGRSASVRAAAAAWRRKEDSSSSLTAFCCHPVVQDSQGLTCRGHGFNKPLWKCW